MTDSQTDLSSWIFFKHLILSAINIFYCISIINILFCYIWGRVVVFKKMKYNNPTLATLTIFLLSLKEIHLLI